MEVLQNKNVTLNAVHVSPERFHTNKKPGRV